MSATDFRLPLAAGLIMLGLATPSSGVEAHRAAILKEPLPVTRPVLQFAQHHHHGAPAAQAPKPQEQSGPIRIGDLEISPPWSRATPGGSKVGVGFMSITNRGRSPDRLLGGSAEFAGILEVHEMRMDGNVMRMRALEAGLEIRPGETVELKPGGFHLMFINLTKPLKAGETLKGKLVFEKAGTVEVTYSIQPPGASAPAHHHH